MPGPIKDLSQQMGLPGHSYYLPLVMPAISEITDLAQPLRMSGQNAIALSRLFLAGSAGFSILVFNAALALRSSKTYEHGLPPNSHNLIVNTSILLLVTFVMFSLAHMMILVTAESFEAVIRAASLRDQASYQTARERFLAYNFWSGVPLLLGILGFIWGLVNSIMVLDAAL